MDITEIRHQPLNTLVADFMVCEACGIVDRDHNRVRVGSSCSRCGVASAGGHIYFPFGALSLIDLMQEYYHLKADTETGNKPPLLRDDAPNKLAVVIFFCTLTEVLLQNFLELCMYEKGIPYEIQKRLLDDNPFVKQRVEKLFPILTGVKWKDAIKKLTQQGQLNRVETVKFCELANEKRNIFLHRGNKWAIPSTMPEQCLRNLPPLISLFVELHNEFIARPLNKP